MTRLFYVYMTQSLGNIPITHQAGEGVRWSDGSVTVKWKSRIVSETSYASMDDFNLDTLHAGATIRWENMKPGDD